MTRHPVELQIEKADLAINREDFDTVMDIYSDDAVLVVKPGMNAVGNVTMNATLASVTWSTITLDPAAKTLRKN